MPTLDRDFMQLAKEITLRPIYETDSVADLIENLEQRVVLGYSKRYDGEAAKFLGRLRGEAPEHNLWKSTIAILKKAQKTLNNIPSLKVWPEYFKPIGLGQKTFEVRQGEFAPGQLLFLKEWDWVKGEYTGRAFLVEITYSLPLTDGGLGDNCVLPFPVDPSLPVVVFGFVKL